MSTPSYAYGCQSPPQWTPPDSPGFTEYTATTSYITPPEQRLVLLCDALSTLDEGAVPGVDVLKRQAATIASILLDQLAADIADPQEAQ